MGSRFYYGKYYQQLCNIIGDSSLIYDGNNKLLRSEYIEQMTESTHYL